MSREDARKLLLRLYPDKDITSFEAALVVVGLEPRLAVVGCSQRRREDRE